MNFYDVLEEQEKTIEEQKRTIEKLRFDKAFLEVEKAMLSDHERSESFCNILLLVCFSVSAAVNVIFLNVIF